MKTIIIYNSKTGFTEQYAKQSAQALNCPCKPLKEISEKTLQNYDQIIYGGWIMGNMITGFEKIQKLASPAAVFAVGATPAYEEVIESIKETNKLGATPFFYMEGGIHFDELSFPNRLLLKTLKKSLAKKENKNRQEIFMEQFLGTSFDHSDEKQIEPLVEYFRNIT